MGLSARFLLLDQTDRIYRLDITRFDRMRDCPGKYPLPQFTGQRVRSAEVAFELVERKPIRVLRATFAILTFDQTGCLDAEAFGRQQVGRFLNAIVRRVNWVIVFASNPTLGMPRVCSMMMAADDGFRRRTSGGRFTTPRWARNRSYGYEPCLFAG